MKKIDVILPFDIGRAKFELFNNTTCVVGRNGSGKTLLLEKIAEKAKNEGKKYIYVPAYEACRYKFSKAAERIVADMDNNFKPDKNNENISKGHRFLLGLIEKAMTPGLELLVLDLPETGLHPEIQNELLALLKCLAPEKAQIVIATNSPDMVQNGLVANIIGMKTILREE